MSQLVTNWLNNNVAPFSGDNNLFTYDLEYCSKLKLDGVCLVELYWLKDQKIMPPPDGKQVKKGILSLDRFDYSMLLSCLTFKEVHMDFETLVPCEKWYRDLVQIRQSGFLSGWPWWCLLIWTFRALDSAKEFLHWVHEWGFCPVWTLLCLFSTPKVLNLLLQQEHPYGFSPVWIISWTVSCVLSLKDLLQYEQGKGLSPR